jgi:hypothetical protein
MKLIRATLFAVASLLSFNTFAIDASSGMSESINNVINSVEKELKVKFTISQRKEFYDRYLKPYTEGKNWNSYYVDTDDMTISKFKDSKVRFYDLTLNNPSRNVFTTFIYYPSAKQIVSMSREIIATSATVAIEAFTGFKASKKDKYISHYDKKNYAMLQKDGYTAFKIFHIPNENSALTHLDYNIFSLD